MLTCREHATRIVQLVNPSHEAHRESNHIDHMTDASVIPKETSLWRWGQCCCFTCLEWALKERRSTQGPQQVKRRLSNTNMSKASSEQELGGFFAALILFAFEVQIDGLWNRAFELAMITLTSVYFPCDTWTYCIASKTWTGCFGGCFTGGLPCENQCWCCIAERLIWESKVLWLFIDV